MTDNNPSVCVNSGTVAAPHFHFVAAFKFPVMGVSVNWIEVKEVTNEHPVTPFVYTPDTSSGYPSNQCAFLLGISDPQNWQWIVASVPIGSGAFTYHNTTYQVTAQYRYMAMGTLPPYPPPMQQYGPFQISITVNVQNMVVTSGDVGKVLKWDPERSELCDTSFGYSIICAQRKQVQVKISIYSMDGVKVYELTEQKICPGSYNFTWDRTVNTGYYSGGYEGEEPTNIAPPGLYTFDVEVMGPAYYYDADWVRSKDLRVVPGPVEYYGYDDNGTPEDESDDKYLYYLRWYALYSGRDASWGEIWLYDPDFEMVGAWAVPMLTCVVHGWNDGLKANPNGEVHGVIIPVPVSVMEKTGTYRFVLHFYDDYADSYKNHQLKAALDVNQKHKPPTYAILVTSYDEPRRLSFGKIARAFLRRMGYTFYEYAISGLQVNLTGRYAIRSLNRLCPLDANNPEAAKKVKKHDVWIF